MSHHRKTNAHGRTPKQARRTPEGELQTASARSAAVGHAPAAAPSLCPTPLDFTTAPQTGAVLLVPSPLNGERVRVRGGSAQTLSHFENATTLPPLTPALSPLRGEGEPFARISQIRTLLAPWSRSAGIAAVGNAPAAAPSPRPTPLDFTTAPQTGAALLVPSPLNGERVRVRGGSAHTLSHFESATTFPPLTPALSPLRGEGEASRVKAISSSSPVPHFPNAARGVASQPKSFRESSARLSIASSRSGASRCSILFSDTHHAPHQLAGAQGIHADLHPVPNCSEPPRNKSRGSGHQFRADGETYTPRNGGRGRCATVASQPKWISSAEVGRGLWAWSDLVGKVSGNCKSRLAAPPLTLTLSPLRGEGTRGARQGRVSLTHSSRPGIARLGKNAANAETGFEIPANAHRVPSPLNGEKVPEGRMRGGRVEDFDLRERLQGAAVGVITPHPNPLPVEGRGDQKRAGIRALPARSSRFVVSLKFGAWNLFGVSTIRSNTAIASPRFPQSHSETVFN